MLPSSLPNAASSTHLALGGGNGGGGGDGGGGGLRT